MKHEIYDFYDRTVLKSYNLDSRMQDQLKALDSLDVFTRKHCENVAALTCRICEYLHCSKNFTEYCTICAYMHDIGKLFIPPSILQKPDKLTNEEYDIMKTHTTIGYEMCMKDEKLRPYSAGPLYHHESLDGSGYPNGLRKKDIPYEAQIIKVADEYDAIVSKRQYKSHVGISDTLKIIINNTKPSENIDHFEALSAMVKNAKLGKDNRIIVRALLKVIIDDICYEIINVQEYLNYLEENIKRFKSINKYYQKMLNSKTEDKKNYFKQYMGMYYKDNENFDNFKEIERNYIDAYNARKTKLNKLYIEIKTIKKLKV